MRVLMINVVCGIRSTGRICTDLAVELEKQGHEVKIAYGRESVPEKFQKYAMKIGNKFNVYGHVIKSRMTDSSGFGSKKVTEKFISWIKEYNPDVIHLHNIHGYYINVKILFEYLKNCEKKIIWTLHDCWSFTGHCTYFDYVACEQWKKGCIHCVQKKCYPVCNGFSRVKQNYNIKQKCFTNIPNMTLVTPSEWLANLVKQSFLKEYPIKVVYNGINTTTFLPIESNIKYQYGLGNKKVILGVAAIWDRRKGLQYLDTLAKQLGDSYKVVVIGVTKKQRKKLSDKIICIPRTNSVEELARWYSCADVFVNPTLEDNYPTTNLEAIACNTPVISFATGGSSESATIYGAVVEQGDISAMCRHIKLMKFEKFDTDISIKRMIQEYLELY